MADYFTSSAQPANNSSLTSSVVRSEFTALETGFTKVAPYTGHADEFVVINAGATAQASITAAAAAALMGAQLTTGKDATGGYVGLTLFKINFKNAANTFTSFFTNANTVARTYTYQDRDGTIADSVDIALKANIANPIFTTGITTPAITLGATALTSTGVQLNYVTGVTSAIQTQLNAKAASGANSDITSLTGLTTPLSVVQGGTGQTNAIVPVGAVALFAGAAAPIGYLFCDGAAVSRTTYAALFTAISTLWGVGDGTTTFNVPDMRGRAPIGVGTGSGLTARSLAATGGAETHTLSTAEMPSHTHTQFNTGTGASGQIEGGGGSLGPTASSVATGATGGGVAHNNMQPFAAINFIIKT